MNKLLTKMGIALLGAALLIAQPVAARNGCSTCPCDPCIDPCNLGGTFEAGAHALYWRPAHCAFEYARSDSSEEVVTVSDIKADYDWGWRVFGAYYRDCSYLRVSYQTIETNDTATQATGEVDVFLEPFGLPGTFNRVDGRLYFNYQNVDVRIGQYLHRKCGCEFSVFGNIRWVDLKRNTNVRGFGAAGPASFVQKAHFEGAGLGVGTSGEFCLWEGLDAFGEFNLMGIIGDRSTPLHMTTAQETGVRTRFNFRGTTCIVPAMDFKVGLSYTFDCWCTSLTLEVGYEMNYYWSALEYENPTGQTTTGSRECFDIGWAGPFAGGRIMF